ncbi:MAG: ATP-grasp domain-containing protein [Bacteroidia bacterium]|nr:ATP-grasp domain-containing protein [Bacteroidia bacterium]
MSIRIIFCDNGLSPKEVDDMFVEEFQAAKDLSIPTSLMSFEELTRGDVNRALKRVRVSEEKITGIYRGWMLKPEQYQLLYDALLQKNIQLINDPAAYKFCHYLPENYESIKDFTPKTTFKELKTDFKLSDFQAEISEFGAKAIVIKDYVKSQKHYWEEACFIPNASDDTQVEIVVRRFLELQGRDLNKGLVFREFVELEKLTHHSKSGMPLTKEFRVFVKHGKVMSIFKYWDEGDYEHVVPVMEGFEEVIPRIKSHFFTMDIAKKKDGGWIIVELGDGQVAGLPENVEKEEFYSKLNM